MVVVYHYGHLSGGFLGVDLFFVLSGYLITRLLVAKQLADGRFRVGWFWARRIRRLAPAILSLLVVVLVWVHYLGGSSLHRLTVGQARSSLVYGSNWYNILTHLSYFDVSLTSTPLNHMWSLAIEEQFYLAWPLLAALFLNRLGRPLALAGLALVLAAASMASAPIVYAHWGANTAYLGTETRVGAILLGASSALFMHSRGMVRRPLKPISTAAMTVLGLAGTAWFFYGCAKFSVNSPGLFCGGLATSSFAELALIGGVVLCPGGLLDRILAWGPIVAIGRRSFALYLWHYPIYVMLAPPWTTWTGHELLAGRIALTAFATEVSYRLIERPIRRSRTSGRRIVVGALVAAVAVAIVSVIPLPAQPAPANVVPNAYAGPVPSSAANLRIMVAGDSWGLRTAYGLTVMAPPRPAQVFDDAQPSCGIADPIAEVGAAGRFTPTTQCLAWRTMWAKTITEQHPDAVLFNIGNWDQAPQQLTAGGAFLQPCDAAYQARYRNQLDTALDVLTAANTPVFMTNVRDNDGAARARSNCMNSMLTSAAARYASKGVYLLDLRQQLCGASHICPPTLHGDKVYDETGHLYIATQVNINAWELQAILTHVHPAQTEPRTTQTAVPQVPTDALTLDAQLRTTVAQATAAFPAGTTTVTESDLPPATNLPAMLKPDATTLTTAAPAARIRILDPHGAVLGRVYAYQFASDAPANQIAVDVQTYLTAHHSTVDVLANNLKSFTVPGATPPEIVGLIRAVNTVVVIDITAPPTQHSLNSYLAILSKTLGN